MIALADLLRDVSGQLGAHGYGFALVGGLAVSAWTDPRFTRDGNDIETDLPTGFDEAVLGGKVEEKENRVVAWLRRRYEPVLHKALRLRVPVIAGAAVLTVSR